MDPSDFTQSLASLQSRLGLKAEQVVPSGPHLICHGWQSDRPVTLKLGFGPEFSSGCFALQRLQRHRRMVRLLDAEPDMGWMLMERIVPGSPVHHVLPDEADILDAWLAALQWIDAEAADRSGITDLSSWCSELWDADMPSHVQTYLPWARALCQKLIETERADYVLHGDLHHYNLLKSASGEPWRVIDPKGLLAGPEFEFGAMLRNPYPDLQRRPDLAQRLALRLQRIAAYAEKQGLSLERIHAWARVQAVLAAIWSRKHEIESGLWLKVADALMARKIHSEV